MIIIYEGIHISAAFRSIIGILLTDKKKQILILLDTG